MYNYIDPIKKQLNDAMHETCQIYMVIGNNGNETPRYYNYGGYENGKLKIQSTQKSELFFTIDIPKELDIEYLYIEFRDFWQQFKEYRNNFLATNYPTINIY